MSRISAVSVISIVSRPGSSPVSCRTRFDVDDELVGVELARGDVDGDADRMAGVAPAHGLPAGLLQHPLADLDDQPGLLEQRDEVVRLHEPARRAAPADQRLHARGAHVVQAERRLVDEEELLRSPAPCAGPSRVPSATAPRSASRLRTARSGGGRPTSPGTSRRPRRAAAPQAIPCLRRRCRCSRSASAPCGPAPASLNG